MIVFICSIIIAVIYYIKLSILNLPALSKTMFHFEPTHLYIHFETYRVIDREVLTTFGAWVATWLVLFACDCRLVALIGSGLLAVFCVKFTLKLFAVFANQELISDTNGKAVVITGITGITGIMS